ncbi:hypothetical protein GGD38_006487 [Chitinophagaceae bacterium OAS944]|nr:hypothetical protein [Chitinophagaceae bacterium OAS944]
MYGERYFSVMNEMHFEFESGKLIGKICPHHKGFPPRDFHVYRYWNGKLNTGVGWYYDGQLIEIENQGWRLEGSVFSPYKDQIVERLLSFKWEDS